MTIDVARPVKTILEEVIERVEDAERARRFYLATPVKPTTLDAAIQAIIDNAVYPVDVIGAGASVTLVGQRPDASQLVAGEVYPVMIRFSGSLGSEDALFYLRATESSGAGPILVGVDLQYGRTHHSAGGWDVVRDGQGKIPTMYYPVGTHAVPMRINRDIGRLRTTHKFIYLREAEGPNYHQVTADWRADSGEDLGNKCRTICWTPGHLQSRVYERDLPDRDLIADITFTQVGQKVLVRLSKDYGRMATGQELLDGSPQSPIEELFYVECGTGDPAPASIPRPPLYRGQNKSGRNEVVNFDPATTIFRYTFNGGPGVGPNGEDVIATKPYAGTYRQSQQKHVYATSESDPYLADLIPREPVHWDHERAMIVCEAFEVDVLREAAKPVDFH